MKKIYETAIILIGTIGWWGFVYPELCLTESSFKQEEQAESAAPEGFWDEDTAPEGHRDKDTAPEGRRDKGAAPERLQDKKAAPEGIWKMELKVGQLRIKSRVAEYVYQVKEKDRSEKESGYDE